MIQSTCERLAIPQFVIEEAKMIYTDNLILSKNKHKEELELSSIFLACRMNSIPRTLKDVSIAGNMRTQYVYRTYNRLIQTGKYKVGVVNPIEFLNRLASNVGVGAGTVMTAQNTLTKHAKMCELVGSDPIIRAGTILYMACIKNGESVTQLQIGEAGNFSPVAIRTQYKKLRDAGVTC